jgi:alpha-tubulin suppressor-like RCC1 family protein/protocatechuate 3,4-dioxygenase beta subunit
LNERLSSTFARTAARLAAGIVAVLSLASCDTTEPRPRVAARVDIVSGDDQEGRAGAELANALAVKVTDDRGRPVRGQTVNFRVVSGGGSISAGTAQTDDQGQIQARWTLGTSTAAADSQRVEARAVDASGATLASVTFSAIARPDAASGLTAVGSNSRSGTAGSVILDSLAVRVTDRFGNPVPNVDVTWTASSGGTVSPASTRTDASGVAKARWTLGGSAGTQTATATVAGLGSVTFTANAATGAAARVTIMPRSFRFTTLGRQEHVTVSAADAFGNPITAPVMLITRDAAVATLEGAPVVRARGNGSTFLVATVQGVSDSIPIVVQQVVAAVGITPASASILVGDTVRYRATAVDSSGSPVTNAQFTWRTGSAAVATVDSAGLVRGTGVGTTSVFAASGGVEASATVTVRPTFAASVVEAGAFHTCAVSSSTTYCWGSNSTRQLGSTAPTTGIPQRVPVGGVTRLAAGGPGVTSQHAIGQTCAVIGGGTVSCWGNDIMRQISGTPATEICRQSASYSYPCRSAPERVLGLESVVSITSGALHSCAVTLGGEGYCWGSNRFGELGTAVPVNTRCQLEGPFGGDGPCSGTPLRVAGAFQFNRISAGVSFTCALTSFNEAYCWGTNTSGQLGSSTPSASTPVPVSGSHRFLQLSSGTSHSCAVRNDRRILCWGAGGAGQLGNGGTSNSSVPVLVAGNQTFFSVTAGATHTCALDFDGIAYCWGSNTNGKLGVGPDVAQSTVPVAVAGGFSYGSISAGVDHTCGIISPFGEVVCWGSRNQGQVGGTPTVGGYFTPQRIPPPESSSPTLRASRR